MSFKVVELLCGCSLLCCEDVARDSYDEDDEEAEAEEEDEAADEEELVTPGKDRDALVEKYRVSCCVKSSHNK